MTLAKHAFTLSIALGAALLFSGCNSQTEPTAAAEPSASNSPSAAPGQAPPPAPPPAVLAEGTAISVRTTTALSTKTASAGDVFAATLEEPLIVGGQTIAPKGAEVSGTVAESDPGGRVSGTAHISLRLTSLTLPNGRRVDLNTGTFRKDAETTKKKDAVKVGIGSGIGAAIGAIAGGGKGAAVGAAVGGGAGAGTVLATRGDAAEVPSETVLTFNLTSAVTVAR